MARSTMEVAFLGTQRFDGEGGVKYIKLFYGDEPDGKTEHGLSIIGMAAADEVADEVFAAGANFAPLETVRVHFEIARGGQNKGKNLVLHVESVKPRNASEAPRAPAAQPQAKA